MLDYNVMPDQIIRKLKQKIRLINPYSVVLEIDTIKNTSYKNIAAQDH